MTKDQRMTFQTRVAQILHEELNPRMGRLKDAPSEELMAYSAAYLHMACLIMLSLGIDKDFFKFITHETIDSIWEADVSRGPLH